MAKGEPLSSPPRTTAIGALAYYVSHANPAHYDPSNITFGIMEPITFPSRNKLARKLAISERALADLERWRDGLSDAQDARDGLKAVPYMAPRDATDVNRIAAHADSGVGHGLQTVPSPPEIVPSR